MSTSMEFQIPADQATEVDQWLESNTKNIELANIDRVTGRIYVHSQLDLDWCETAECADPEYFRKYFTKRLGKCEWQIFSGMEESDYALVADILCDLNEKFDVKYQFNIFGEDECKWYFNKEQQQRITNCGERLYVDLEGYKDEVEMLRRVKAISNFLSGKTWEELNGINLEPSESKERAVSLHVEFTKNNDNFYPTPKSLAERMLSKIDYGRNIKTVLEPSAGKGDLIKVMKEFTFTTSRGHGRSPFQHGNINIMAIEKDKELMANLMGKRIDVIDSDFLSYGGLEQFDLIVMNPPFDEGEKHLHKALDIMFTGQIVCLLNASTIKNPFSNERKRLVQRLKELKADIEYIPDAFNDIDSQRKTNVEVALIYINVEADVETNIFNGMREEEGVEVEEISENYEIKTFNQISNLVIQFNRERELVNNQIMDFYKNHKFVGKYLSLKVGPNDADDSWREETLTETMKRKLNQFNNLIKTRYWRDAINLEEIQARVTTANSKKIDSVIADFTKMEFTESNIRQLILNVIADYPRMIQESIQWMFDEMTRYALKDYRWSDECDKNIHYFNGWKTNKGYIVNEKVIIPSFHLNWDSSRYRVSDNQQRMIDDFTKVMSYFDGEISSNNAGATVNEAICVGQNTKINTKYFEISVYKKGTVHFKFKDKDLLRRFNIEACKGKEWLPMDYSEKPWESMDEEEKEVAESFEGSMKNYTPIYDGILRLGQAPLLNLLPQKPETSIIKDDEVATVEQIDVVEVMELVEEVKAEQFVEIEPISEVTTIDAPAKEANIVRGQQSLFEDENVA